MRRTLLAVGIAALVSMLFTPHRDDWDLARQYDWARTGKFFPVFWVDASHYGERNTILWSEFAGQTAFIAVLAAVLVNLRKSPKSSCEISRIRKVEARSEDHPNELVGKVEGAHGKPDNATRNNYFARHWRGELSLARAYWLNGIVWSMLLALAVNPLLIVISIAVGSLGIDSKISVGLAGSLCVVVFIAYEIWWATGTWASAHYQFARGGNIGFAKLARAMVGLSVIIAAYYACEALLRYGALLFPGS